MAVIKSYKFNQLTQTSLYWVEEESEEPGENVYNLSNYAKSRKKIELETLDIVFLPSSVTFKFYLLNFPI